MAAAASMVGEAGVSMVGEAGMVDVAAAFGLLSKLCSAARSCGIGRFRCSRMSGVVLMPNLLAQLFVGTKSLSIEGEPIKDSA